MHIVAGSITDQRDNITTVQDTVRKRYSNVAEIEMNNETLQVFSGAVMDNSIHHDVSMPLSTVTFGLVTAISATITMSS